MAASIFQYIKLTVVEATGLSRDALHIYVGLTIFLLAAVVFRKTLRSVIPLLVIFLVAVFGELLDMRDDISTFGYWHWRASLHDLMNTLFWPVILLFLARYSMLFSQK